MKEKELIDTHCHLYLEEFSPDLPVVMRRAEEEKVSRIYMPSLDSRHLEGMLAVEKQYPGVCFPMAGVHPCYIKDDYQEELDIMREWLGKRKFSAVGEI